LKAYIQIMTESKELLDEIKSKLDEIEEIKIYNDDILELNHVTDLNKKTNQYHLTYMGKCNRYDRYKLGDELLMDKEIEILQVFKRIEKDSINNEINTSNPYLKNDIENKLKEHKFKINYISDLVKKHDKNFDIIKYQIKLLNEYKNMSDNPEYYEKAIEELENS